MKPPAYILSVSMMKAKKLFEFRNIIRLLTVICGCCISLRYASECTAGIKKGILFCAEALVPSLFLFMALSSYIVKSGIAAFLSKPLGGAAKALFRLPPQSMAVILIGLIGGYPVGARCAAGLYEEGQLTEKEAEKTACIAVAAGPGFLLNFVGGALLGNPKAGALLLGAQVIGTLMSGFLIGRLTPHEASSEQKIAPKAAEKNLLTTCVADACDATLKMCGMVVIFAALTEVIASVCGDTAVTDMASAFIEITTGCHRMCGKYPLYLIAFFIGFGGLSVHWQIFAGLGELSVNKSLFFLYRMIQGMITAGAAYILFMIFPLEQRVFNSTDAPLTAAGSSTIVGSAALVLLSFCFLGGIRQHHRLRSDSP